MCDIPSRQEQDVPTTEMKSLIDEFLALKTSGLGFTGGEPLLRRDIFELISHARRASIPVTLNTNGLLLDEERIEKLLQAGPTNVNISLDGGSAATHDRLRGGPFFDRTLKAIQQLSTAARQARSQTRVTVVTVLSEENIDELPRLVDIVADSGAHRWGVMPLHNTRDGTACAPLPAPRMQGLSKWLTQQKRIEIDNSPSYLASLEDAWKGSPFPRRCNAGFTSLFVDSNRRVYPCLGYYMMGRSVHRLEHDGPSLSQLWYSEAYRAVRQETLRCRQCYLNCQAELNFMVRI